MRTILLILSLFLSTIAFSQEANLQLVKNGRVKKRIANGTPVVLITHSGSKYVGEFYIATDSLLSIVGQFVPVRSISSIKLIKPSKKPFDWKQFGWVSLGVALSSVGMAAAGWESNGDAIVYSSVLGYSPYVLRSIKKLIFSKKMRWKLGVHRKLRVWDMRRVPAF